MLRHLTRKIRMLGPLRWQDTAPFESAIGISKNHIRSTNKREMEFDTLKRQVIILNKKNFLFLFPNNRLRLSVLIRTMTNKYRR